MKKIMHYRKKYRHIISFSVLYLVTVQRKAVYKTDSKPSPDTRAAGTLALDMLAFRAMKNRFLLFKPPT